ncbi:MAG: type II secretion system F family protein [Gaiellales bacterium]
MLLFLAFLCLTASLAIVGKLVTQPARDRQASLRRAKGLRAEVDELTGEPLVDRLEERYGATLAAVARRLDPRLTEERIATRLVSSGLARHLTANGFLALKVVLASAGVIGGGLIGVLLASGTKALVVGATLGAIGFLAPDALATSRARARRDEMQRQLPDALDIVAVSVEAGLGFDAALGKLGEHLSGPIVDELTLVLGELRIGEARSVALRRMADRVDLPEVSSLVNALIQADQLGSPLGRMLRVQAEEARNRRQVAAEERAMKAPVKMLIPTVLFIFPAMFVVILGPALIKISEAF